jgi:hypothetical protein
VFLEKRLQTIENKWRTLKEKGPRGGKPMKAIGIIVSAGKTEGRSDGCCMKSEGQAADMVNDIIIVN